MSLSLSAITVDCRDALNLATFWSQALGRPVDEGGMQYFATIGLHGGGPTHMFIAVPEPRTTKNRMHCDFHADDREAEVARLEGLGATRLWDKDEHGMRWTTMADPEGNEFCVADQVHAEVLG